MKTIPLSEILTNVTPLPWRCNLGNGSNLSGDPTIWGGDAMSVIGELVADPAFPMSDSQREMPANAAYLAHAANVLPELLAAITPLLNGAIRVSAMRNDMLSEHCPKVITLREAVARASSVPVN